MLHVPSKTAISIIYRRIGVCLYRDLLCTYVDIRACLRRIARTEIIASYDKTDLDILHFLAYSFLQSGSVVRTRFYTEKETWHVKSNVVKCLKYFQ